MALIDKENILRILQETKTAIKNEDTIKLKELSNQTIHSASIHQDIDNITIAILVYSLSKILERTNYHSYPSWQKFFNSMMNHIEHSILALKKNNEDKFRYELKKIRQDINKLTGNFKRHIQEVFEKASINKASRIYEHGISMEKAAKILGISMWDFVGYTGKTGIADVNLSLTMPVKERIKILNEIFE